MDQVSSSKADTQLFYVFLLWPNEQYYEGEPPLAICMYETINEKKEKYYTLPVAPCVNEAEEKKY